MKTLIFGAAVLCLGTVGLASAKGAGCESTARSSSSATPASPLGFSTIGGIGRRTGSPV